MDTFTITRYKRIGECPIVILINHPYSGGEKFNTVESLIDAVISKNEKIYFTADANDNEIHGLNTWNDNCIHCYSQNLLNYLTL